MRGCGAQIDSRWAYDGQPIIRIENDRLRADVMPGMGGKILNLVDKVADRNVLWRNPRVAVRRGPIGANVDDYFAGGWDDAFPTGDPCLNEWGDELPYMGEVWNLALEATVESGGPEEVAVVLDGHTPITPARWTRTIRLRSGEPVIHLETRIENVGQKPFSFSMGSHPALAVREGMRLDVPARTGFVADAGDGRSLGRAGERYAYPHVPSVGFDVRRVPAPQFRGHGLHALVDLSDGWVAATDPQSRRGFGVTFDSTVHRAVWQWMSYGGFRGWYHAILEPWTAPEPALADAVAAGTARSLRPGESVESRMAGVLYGGVRAVERLDSDGSVSGAA